jgi:hypothetical protein
VAAVTLLGTATFSTASGTKTVTATPAVGDLIIIVTANSGSTTTTAAPTDNNSSGTYTVVNTSVKATSADTMQVWVRNALIASASSTVFTQAPGTTTGGGLVVLKIPNASVAGSSAIIRSAIQSNQATSTTPAPVLGATPSSDSAIVTAVFNASNTASVTVRSGYTSRADLGYNTPTSGLIVATRDSGETSATITWGGTSGSAFGSIAVEVSGAIAHSSSGAITGPGSSVSGSSTRTSAAHPTHDATGYIEAPGGALGSLSGTSTVAAPVTHSSSGDLVGVGSVVAGSSTRSDPPSSSVTHDATGYVEAQNGAIGSLSGTSTHSVGGIGHVSSGDLVGQGAIVSGLANRVGIPHTSSGALVGPGSVVAGTSTHSAGHTSSGALVGQGSAVAGTSTRTPAPVTHSSSGALVGPGAVVSGSSTRSGSPEVFPAPSSGNGRSRLRNRW